MSRSVGVQCRKLCCCPHHLSAFLCKWSWRPQTEHVSTRTCVSNIAQPTASTGSASPGGGTGYRVHVLLLGLIKLPQVPLGNKILQVYFAGFFFFFSLIPRTNEINFSAYLHTDTKQGADPVPVSFPFTDLMWMCVNWAMRAVLDSLLREHPYGFCLEQWRRSSYGPVSTFSLLESASCVRAPCKLSANSPLFFFPLCEVEIEADKIMGCDYLHVLCNYMFRLGLDFCHFHLRS